MAEDDHVTWDEFHTSNVDLVGPFVYIISLWNLVVPMAQRTSQPKLRFTSDTEEERR